MDVVIDNNQLEDILQGAPGKHFLLNPNRQWRYM